MKTKTSKKKTVANRVNSSNCCPGSGDCQPPRELARREFLGRMISSSLLLAAGSSLGYAPEASAAADTAASAMDTIETPPAPTTLAAPPANPEILLQAVNHSNGIPLGGIGTGSVEILPDGCLDDWIIFNMGSWSPDQSRADGGPSNPAMDSQAMQFFLRAQAENGPVMVRHLSVRAGQQDLYGAGWCKPVSAIAYEGRYPVAKLTYQDAALPLSVTGTYFSPLIPQDSRTSGTPGFYAIFTLKNTSRSRVEVAISGKLKNPLARGDDNAGRSVDTRKLTNAIVKDGATTYLTMRTDATLRQKSTLGSIGLSVTGGEASWISADFGDYLSNGSARTLPRSYLEALRAEGHLPNLGEAGCPAGLLGGDVNVANLPEAELDSALAQLSKVASMKVWIDRSKTLKSGIATLEAKRQVARELQDRLNNMAGRNRRAPEWGDAALCSSLSIQPGEEKEIAFTLGWYFPHHISTNGPELGHRYEEWFKDAEDVNRFLVSHGKEHRAKVTAFADTMADSSVGRDIAFCWTAQLTTLVKSSWWTRDNKFAIWEGLGCCGLHTMDITYQGSFPLIALYPDLQKNQMENGARFQRADGRVAHFFHHDLDTVDNGFGRVDMNPQFVMLVCRDWLWTADDAYIKRLWPNIVRAMDSMAVMDTDKDGLPDTDTRLNTYDQWDLRGIPAYICSLWLGALPSAIRMARAVSDSEHEAAWKSWLAMAVVNFDKKLWNGEYYSLWVDGADRDECCMSDQLSGIWFSHISGLNSAVAPARVRETLKTVFKYNFTSEQGLLNATYPPGRAAYEPTFGNFQATGNWTGIEYANAALAIDFGLVQEGLDIIRAVDDRYRRAGRCWNHVECGDHYYRAMSSWATLLALTGFKIDAPAATVSILPVVRQPKFTAPWVSATGWGNLELTNGVLTVNCASGKLSLRRLRVNLTGGTLQARLAGSALVVASTRANGVTTLDFKSIVELQEGQTLTVKG
jgi:uncharacterized protein (DUF608 family)